MLKKRCTSVKSSSIFVNSNSKPSFNIIKSLNPSNYSNKKAQVTIFIILGLILLISAVLVFLLKKEIISFRLEQVSLSESGKVETYILDCLEEVGNEALTLASMQGGYITVPERYTEDLEWHIPYAGFLFVPLWANGLTIDKPHIDYSKIQIDEYIVENLRSCLYSDAAFQESYDLIEHSDVQSDTEFKDTSTRFKVKWNVLIKDKAGELVSEVINHEIISRVQFKKMHEMATRILEYEMDQLKLEDLTQDLIALEHPNVPVTGLELSCQQKRWRVDQAERTLKDMLRINLRNLRIKGTDFVEFSDDFPYYQNHYVWDLHEYVDDLAVTFRFDDTHPFNFQVTPHKGNYMLSGQMGGGTEFLDFLCIQNWKFTYDVVYPVVVEVRDQISGVTFKMAFTVNLIKNYPNKGDTMKARESLFTSTSSADNYCYNSASYVPMTVISEENIDDPLSGVYYNEPLEEVNVTYTCLKYRCKMGQTEYDFQNSGDMAGLSAKFPYCAAAIMRGNKEGYLEDWEYVIPEEGKQVELSLKPLFQFSLNDVNIIKHKIEEVSCEDEGAISESEDFCYSVAAGVELGADESVMVTLINYKVNLTVLDNQSEDNSSSEEIANTLGMGLSNYNGNLGEESHRSEFVYSPSLDEVFMNESFVEILRGANFEYDVKVHLVDEQELIGGYKGKWTIPWSNINPEEGVESNKVVFHVLEINPNDQEEFFHFFGDLEKYSGGILSPQVE